MDFLPQDFDKKVSHGGTNFFSSNSSRSSNFKFRQLVRCILAEGWLGKASLKMQMLENPRFNNDNAFCWKKHSEPGFLKLRSPRGQLLAYLCTYLLLSLKR